MAGSLRGNRLGQTRDGSPMDIDPNDERRRVGLLLRELRIHAGLSYKQFAEEMNARLSDVSWTHHTVQMVSTGRRNLRYREMQAIAQLFEVPWDAILETALGSEPIAVTVETLTEEQVVDIREAYEAGAPVNALCKTFGVTAGTISRIVNGVSWKHAAGPITRKEAE